MKITRCKLSKTIQLRLLEYFVLQVTARSAADILNIHPNTAAMYYRKIREVISYYLEKEAEI
ncbi:MAG: IS1595 family transposase, partial [Elainellaceae cyanobacterium]